MRIPIADRLPISRGTANVSFDRLGNQRASDRYEFDPRSGEITNVSLYQNAEPSGRFGDGYIQCMWEVGAACLPNTSPLLRLSSELVCH